MGKRFNYSDFLEVSELIEIESDENRPVVFIFNTAINLDKPEILSYITYGLITVIDKSNSINSIFIGNSSCDLEPLRNNSQKPFYISILIQEMSIERLMVKITIKLVRSIILIEDWKWAKNIQLSYMLQK